jgi:Polysaccharide deacetylase
VTTCRRSEIDRLYRGVVRFSPEEWDRFRAGVPEAERDGNILAAHARLMESPDAGVRRQAADDWLAWEDAVTARELARAWPDARVAVAHHDMTSLSDAEMLEDLKSSRRALERKLGHRAPWLAYPFGAYDERVERLTRRAGYLLAVTTRPGTVQSAGQPFALPRLRILDTTGVRGLAALLGASARA